MKIRLVGARADILIPAEPSRANADDGLSVTSFGRIEGSDGILKGRNLADVGPQSSVADSLNDLGQLGAISLDDKVDS